MRRLLLAAALLAAQPLPAMADVACDVSASAPCGPLEPGERQARPVDWLAPLDDVPGRRVRLAGFADVPANEGSLDRVLRVAAGLGLVAVGALDPWSTGSAPLRAGAGAAGVVLLWTGFTGSCPIYTPLGVSTRCDLPSP